MKHFICELCGAATEGDAAACGAELCSDCCEACYDAEGYCEDLDRQNQNE